MLPVFLLTRRFRNVYAAARRLVRSLFPDARHTFSYDAVGQRTLMLDPSGRYTAAFDPAGRVSRVENPGDQTLTYLYDDAGQRTNLLDADGGRFTYGFDQAGRNTRVVNPQGERTTLLYDAAGRKIASYLANGAHASLTYDPAGRNTEVRNVSSLDATLSRFNYTFDDAGNKTQVVEAAGGVVTWSYDDTYQLTRERRSGANSYDTTYTYDSVGNRLLKIDGGARTTYAYDLANQLQTSVASAGVTTFTHDAAGNRTAKQSPSGLATYQWNGDGRLVQVSAPGVAVTYVYNADRQRVKIDDGSQQQGFVYDAAKLLAEYDTAEGSTTAQYTDTLEDTYGDLVSQHRPDEQLSGGETSYHAFDGLGSTDALLNPSEAATDTWQYKAFGEILHRTGSSENPFTFVGKFGYYANPEIDLYYLNDRYYSPVEGRFISIDSLGFDAGDGNLYTYVDNRPTWKSDPSGLMPDEDLPPCRLRIFGGHTGEGEQWLKKTFTHPNWGFVIPLCTSWIGLVGRYSAQTIAPVDEHKRIPKMPKDVRLLDFDKVHGTMKAAINAAQAFARALCRRKGIREFQEHFDCCCDEVVISIECSPDMFTVIRDEKGVILLPRRREYPGDLFTKRGSDLRQMCDLGLVRSGNWQTVFTAPTC